MRHVVYLLLVGNLAFFGWHMLELQKQDGMARALPAIPATATLLVTLQEMEQKQAQDLASEPESKLESEIDPELLGPAEQQVLIESLTELMPPGGGGAITCRTLGPILAAAQLKSLVSKLDELGLEPRHRTSEKKETTSYWVYLPAMKYSQALEIKDKLDKRKDKDYYIKKDNVISLGVFNEKSRAEVRLSQVQKLGLEAVLEPRYEIQTVNWLDIDRQTGDAVDLGAVMEEYPGVKLQEQACY
jgi:Holliday junction resolvase